MIYSENGPKNNILKYSHFKKITNSIKGIHMWVYEYKSVNSATINKMKSQSMEGNIGKPQI